MNWTEDTTTVQFLSDDDQGSYYFVGAIVALGSAIFCALNNILTAKIVRFYWSFIGLSAFYFWPTFREMWFQSMFSCFTWDSWVCLWPFPANLWMTKTDFSLLPSLRLLPLIGALPRQLHSMVSLASFVPPDL